MSRGDKDTAFTNFQKHTSKNNFSTPPVYMQQDEQNQALTYNHYGQQPYKETEYISHINISIQLKTIHYTTTIMKKTKNVSHRCCVQERMKTQDFQTTSTAKQTKYQYYLNETTIAKVKMRKNSRFQQQFTTNHEKAHNPPSSEIKNKIQQPIATTNISVMT